MASFESRARLSRSVGGIQRSAVGSESAARPQTDASRPVQARAGRHRSPGGVAVASWARSPLVRVLPIAIVGLTVALRFVYENAYHFGTKEDGFAEWLTALAYVITSGLALLVVRAAWSRSRIVAFAYGALVVGAFFVAGEEVSWGQRLFGFAGPEELTSANLQGEANLHNLLAGHLLHTVYILVGLYGAWLARPIVDRLPFLRPAFAFVPPTWARPWFATAALYYLYVELVDPLVGRLGGPTLLGVDLGRLQEVVELILSVGFLGFVCFVWERFTHDDDRAQKSGR